MEASRDSIELKEVVNDSSGNELDSHIISNIMTYLYGEPKSSNRIAQYLQVSPVKLQIYMDYLEDINLVDSFEEVDEEMIEKKYRVSPKKQDLEVNVKLTDNLALMQYADELCMNLKNNILSLAAEDINELSYYVGEVPLNALQGTIDNIKKLQNEVEESEKNITEKDKSEKYMLITAFIPYKQN